MVVNEESRQVQIAEQLAEVARILAHSSRGVPNPADSYRLLGEMEAAVAALSQVAAQLAHWHGLVVDGREFVGEDERGDGVTGTVAAVVQLEDAAGLLEQARQAISAAYTANGVVRWRGE